MHRLLHLDFTFKLIILIFYRATSALSNRKWL